MALILIKGVKSFINSKEVLKSLNERKEIVGGEHNNVFYKTNGVKEVDDDFYLDIPDIEKDFQDVNDIYVCVDSSITHLHFK